MKLYSPAIKRIRSASLLSAAFLVGATASAQDLQLRRDLVSFGMSKEAVLAVLPAPTTTTESMTMGLTTMRLQWVSPLGGPVLIIDFLAGRVLHTKWCDRAAEC